MSIRSGKMSRKYCPDCRSILTSIILLSNFDVPNEFRTNTYFCCRCSNRLKTVIVFCFSSTKLADFKQKGKFPSAVRYADKLVNYLKSKNQSFLYDAKNPKKHCPFCKEPLLYDKEASNLKEDVIKIRTFFHSCKNNNQELTHFFFASQEIESRFRVNRIVIA